jgi:hypothetical protein
MKVQENIQKLMNEQKAEIEKEREELTVLAKEIQAYGGQISVPVKNKDDAKTAAERARAVMPDLLNVFSEKDRFE